MLVKPAPGLALRDPDTMQRIPDEGIEVPDFSPIWNRMLATGDVVKVDKAAPAAAPPAPPAPPAAPKDDAR